MIKYNLAVSGDFSYRPAYIYPYPEYEKIIV
jgi:hypothetical protein